MYICNLVLFKLYFPLEKGQKTQMGWFNHWNYLRTMSQTFEGSVLLWFRVPLAVYIYLKDILSINITLK